MILRIELLKKQANDISLIVGEIEDGGEEDPYSKDPNLVSEEGVNPKLHKRIFFG